jgi:hypothetical protein
MNRGELLDYLTKVATKHFPDARSSMLRNTHLSGAYPEDINAVSSSVIKAVLIDFINFIGMEQGMDYALTHHEFTGKAVKLSEKVQKVQKADPAYSPEFKWTVPLHNVGPKHKPWARLIGRVDIGDTSFHVNAEAIKTDNLSAGDEQVGELPASDTYVDEIQMIIDGAGETISIKGHQYLMVVTPFQK